MSILHGKCPIFLGHEEICGNCGIIGGIDGYHPNAFGVGFDKKK